LNIKQSVNFLNGTLNNLVVANGKLQLPSVAAPSFSRNSVAYLFNGTLVNTNQPRLEIVNGRKGILVEEGTTNLVPNILFLTTSGLLPYSSATLIANLDGGVITNTKVLQVNTSMVTGSGFSFVSISATIGQTYTFSIYLKGSGQVQLFIAERDSNDNWIAETRSNTITLTDKWLRYTVSRTNSSGAKIRVGVVTTAAQAITFYANAPQLEQKPYVTTFVNGTRSAEVLTIPTAGILNTQEGTIDIICQVNSITYLSNNVWLFSLATSSSPLKNVLGIKCYRGCPEIWVYDDSGKGGSYSYSSVLPIGWHMYTLRWNAQEIALFLDGVKIISKSNPNLPSVLPSLCYIGAWAGGGMYQFNSFINAVRISNRARTDAEIATAYAKGYLEVDEWTTYLLDAEKGIQWYGQGGYYLSPEFDLSAVGTAIGSKISWQEDADGIVRKVYAKLDNQADWVEVVNGGKLPINAGDVLTGRKLQLKVKLLKSA